MGTKQKLMNESKKSVKFQLIENGFRTVTITSRQ